MQNRKKNSRRTLFVIFWTYNNSLADDSMLNLCVSYICFNRFEIYSGDILLLALYMFVKSPLKLEYRIVRAKLYEQRILVIYLGVQCLPVRLLPILQSHTLYLGEYNF